MRIGMHAGMRRDGCLTPIPTSYSDTSRKHMVVCASMGGYTSTQTRALVGLPPSVVGPRVVGCLRRQAGVAQEGAGVLAQAREALVAVLGADPVAPLWQPQHRRLPRAPLFCRQAVGGRGRWGWGGAGPKGQGSTPPLGPFTHLPALHTAHPAQPTHPPAAPARRISDGRTAGPSRPKRSNRTRRRCPAAPQTAHPSAPPPRRPGAHTRPGTRARGPCAAAAQEAASAAGGGVPIM